MSQWTERRGPPCTPQDRSVARSLEASAGVRAASRPWSAEAIFGRVAPLEIEVGSGKGLFLRNAARSHPDVDFLGIEIAHKYARFAAAGLAKAGLPNGRVVSGDGMRIFAELIPDWLAGRGTRLLSRSLVEEAAPQAARDERDLRCARRADAPAGRSLHFWTDVEEYFQATLELLAAHTRLFGPIAVPERAAEHDLAYRTHFERRMRLSNEPVFRAEFHKAAVPFLPGEG